MFGANSSCNQNNVGDSYKHKQKYETTGERESTQNLFTQFDPIMT